MEICCIYKGKHTVEVELGGLLLTGTREIHVATHSSSTPTITQGGGSGLLLCVREIKAEAAHAVQGVVCVLLHKGKHTAHGEVTLHGGPLCDVRCVACVVVRCVSCVVENKKSNTKMVYRPALRRRARSGAAPARRRATPLCKKTRGGEINT
jgi:hypothetical protein